MTEQRAGALGGLWFVVLSVGAGVLLPKPPAADSSAATIGRYLHEHQHRIQAASVISALAALGLLVLVAAMRQRLAADPMSARLALSGGVLVVAVALLGATVQASIALVGSRLGGASLVLAYAIDNAVFFTAPAFAVAALLVGVARGAAAAGLPTWLGGLGLLVAALGIAGGVAGLTSTSSAASVLGLAGFGLTVVWVAATSATLLRSDASAHAKAVPATA